MGKTFIRGKQVITVDSKDTILNDGLVVVEDDKILEVGAYADLKPKYQDVPGEWVEFPNGVILPGLVCSHTHMDQSLMRGIGCHLPMEQWVTNVVYRMHSKMGRQENYDAARLNMLEMISTGTTCFADSHFVNHFKDGVDGVADAMIEMGMRGYLSRGTIDLHPYPGVPDSIIESVDFVEKEAVRCIETYHNTQNGRIRVSVEPVCVTDCSLDMMKMLYGLAETYDTMFQIHAVETYPEFCTVKGQYGCGEIEFLDRNGMLSERTLLIHSIWITPKEKVLIAQRKANVNHNPAGNMLLGDGTAPIPDLVAMGVNVGLGVDGASTNNSQDMIETMKLGALLHRNSTLNAGVFTAYDMIKMATIGSARAIGWADEIGSLEVGKKADLIVVSTDSPAMTPSLANINNLVFSSCGRDVDTVMIDGRFVMKNRKMLFVDEKEILTRATQTAQRVAEETGVLHLI